jgi:multidrug efflux pump subunit AcrB
LISSLVNRPIAVLMTFFGLVILGIVVFKAIPVSLLPNIPIPKISVQISYPNSAARELENSVTRPIRNQLMQVAHLRDIHSRTRDNYATIELDFDQGTNTNLAFLEVNEKIDQIIGNLPRELPRPRVIKTNASDVPVYFLSVYPRDESGDFDLELSEFSRSVLKRRIEQLPEVAFVDRTGYAEPQLLIRPDQALLLSAGLTEQQLVQALVENNVSPGNIILKDGQYQYHVEFLSELRSKEEVESLYLKTGTQIIRLKDVAEVEYTAMPLRGLHLYNNRKAVLFTVRKQADAQLFALKAAFDTLVHQLQLDYPQLAFVITNDQSRLLEVSMSNLQTSLLYGGGFAFLIMFLFYRDWRSPVLIGVAIPVALIMTILGFYFIDLSINVISLSGLILGVGLMVDNSIIIIDNIRQYESISMTKREAAARGASEVIKPLISSALTTCSVFVPLIFLSGISGALFYDQALSITIALGSSLLVAYFLLPVLWGLSTDRSPDQSYRIQNPRYRRSVSWALDNSRWIIFIFLGLIGAGAYFLVHLNKNAFPDLTRDAVVIKIDWNEPLRVEESWQRCVQLRSAFEGDITASNSFVGEKQFLLLDEEQGIHESEMILYLRPEVDSEELSGRLQNYIAETFPGSVASVSPLENLFDKMFANVKPDLVAHIQDSRENLIPEPEDLRPVMTSLLDRGVQLASPPLQVGYAIRILTDQVQLYKMDYQVIYNKLRTLFNQNLISKLRASDQYIPVNLGTGERSIYRLIEETEIPNQAGQYLPLKYFVQVDKVQSLKTITAGKGGESLDFSFPRYSDQLVNEIKKAVSLTRKHTVSFSGQYFENQQTIRQLLVIMGVSLFLLFLILAAQFESLTQPLIVMLTVPAGITGSMLGLYLLGESINIISVIGMIVTSGIVVNDAILKVDMMNRARKEHSIVEAIHIGGERRLKPILMTTLTTVLALTPILFSGGLGAELQRPLAISVIFGLTLGTVSSLYFVPVVWRKLTL